MRAVFLALALVSVPAGAAEQFDLICKAQKVQVRYRIDLASGEWCAGECKVVMKIAEVTSGLITLERSERRLPRDEESRTEINRATGEWHTYAFNPGLDVLPLIRDGNCEPADFSGFPARKF